MASIGSQIANNRTDSGRTTRMSTTSKETISAQEFERRFQEFYDEEKTKRPSHISGFFGGLLWRNDQELFFLRELKKQGIHVAGLLDSVYEKI